MITQTDELSKRLEVIQSLADRYGWDRYYDEKKQVILRKLIKAGALSPLKCACCGRYPLKHPRSKGGIVLGSECVKHYPDSCCRQDSRLPLNPLVQPLIHNGQS